MVHNYVCPIFLACMMLFSGCQTSSIAKDISTKPDFSFRLPTEKEEFGIIWNTLKKMPFYNKHGYRVELPKQEEFQQLAEKPDRLAKKDRARLYAIFINQEYNENHYEKGLRVLKSEAETVREALAALMDLKRLWGFKLYNHYDVVLTLYGPGGLYHPLSGKVSIRTTMNGSFLRKEPVNTVVHEMVHLGIQENIVERFDLNHREKERLVDYICSTHLGHVLKGYKEMSHNDSPIDEYLDKNAIQNLPESIEKYQKDFLDALVIERIYENSQARDLGLKKGDIVYRYDDIRTTDPNKFAQIVRNRSKKNEIEIVIIRGGEIQEFSLKGGRIGIKIAVTKIAKKNIPDS